MRDQGHGLIEWLKELQRREILKLLGKDNVTDETEYNLKMNLAQRSSKDERSSNISSSPIYDYRERGPGAPRVRFPQSYNGRSV